jgi:ribosomal-protein-alanine N-acetyltransferase
MTDAVRSDRGARGEAPARPDLKHVSMLWASVDHAADLAALHATLFETAWDVAAFNALLSHPGSTSMVARVGNPQETIGFIIARLAADEAEIVTLGVGKPYQRAGIARRLIEGVARAARRAEAKRLLLEVAADNMPAAILYSRLGMVEVGRRPGYYQRASGPPVDALVLSLAL